MPKTGLDNCSTLCSAALRAALVALMRKHGAMFAVSAFLALALTCEADVLVSSDADLLVLDTWHGVPIVTPGAFLLL